MLKKTALNILSYGIEKAKCHHIKLFYLSMYCMLMVGCGKKVKNQVEEQDIRRDTLTANSIILEDTLGKLASKTTGKSIYTFTQDSSVRIPASITVEAGNAGNNYAVIYFNSKSQSEFDFYCKYKGGATTSSPATETDFTNGLYYHFETCYTQENDIGEVGYYPGYEVINFSDNSLILDLLSADPRYNTQVAAEIEVNWH